MYPIDKTNLDVLRFAHFLALAALTVHFIPRDWPVLQSPWLRPAILCGQHSLEIFCLGVFLAFAAHFVMVEFYGGAAMQVLISIAGILHYGWHSVADLVVQADGSPRIGNAEAAAGCRPCRRRGMKKWTALGRAVAMGAIVLCSAAARGEAADICAVPGYLLFGDSQLDRVHAAVNKDKELKIVALGGTSSTLPGPDGASFAYPARLEAALTRRLPGVKVTVTAVTKPRQTAAEMAESIEQLLLDQKPSLVVWQTGTYDAVRGTDPEEFRASVADGVEKLQAGGADVVLVNMQYSPRTESIVAVGAYADGMRWVSREREVPVFDRLAIMRHWYDAGQFDLYKATKDLKMAKSVHDCLGRALAATIIDAAHLEAREEAAPQ